MIEQIQYLEGQSVLQVINLKLAEAIQKIDQLADLMLEKQRLAPLGKAQRFDRLPLEKAQNAYLLKMAIIKSLLRELDLRKAQGEDTSETKNTLLGEVNKLVEIVNLILTLASKEA